MKVIADVCVTPMGVDSSVNQYVKECEKVFQDSGLKTVIHAYGTNVEGEWDEVNNAIKRCHETLHNMGVPRLSTSVKIDTRTDKTQTMEDKIRGAQIA